jgi:eukaryotic-like serine/threonine-protein kinase
MPDFRLSDWDDVGDMVQDALAAAPGPQRERVLEEACGADPTRLARARAVLAAAQRAESFLARPAADLAPDLIAGHDREAAAGELTHVGAYRILELIGRGGMGEVYLAERDDAEFERRVAVKVVKAGLGADLVARFLSERQVLASLDHPHIAQLHDGGVAADGRPYLVMEHVVGQPLDRFADDGALSIDRRLEIFLQVCDAVGRAHRSLVVHRDLKPANILVSSDGTAKLLDFGVAKLLDPQAASGEPPATRIGMRILTPEYASPEQFLGEPTTTATDVYALGVILYELLSGRRPHEESESTVAALEPHVLAGAVTAPSVACRVATTRSRDVDRARARGLSVDALSRALRGDLDTIVLTALRREPDRRYQSVAALADDIVRHRAGRPILARPTSVRYRASKFVRRHRFAVTAAALFFVAIVAGTAATLVQARAAAREGQRAAQTRDFLVGVFEVSDPDRARGQTITARDLLDRGSERIRRERTMDPALRADLLEVLGNLYLRLGVFDRARAHLEEALALNRSARASPAALVASLSSLASVHDAQGEAGRAEALLREALAGARSSGGSRAVEAGVLSDLASVHRSRGEFTEAEARARDALAIRREVGDPAGLADTLNGLGVTLQNAGRSADAIAVMEEGLAFARRAYGQDHTKTILLECNLAQARHRAGQLDAALDAFHVCVASRRRLLGNAHPDVALSLNNQAQVYSDRNEYDAAERLFLESLAINRKAYGERHREVAASLNNLAIVAYQRGRYADAASRFRELTTLWQALLGPKHPDSLTSLNNFGMALRNAGQLAEAEQVLAEVLDGRIAALGREHPDAIGSVFNLSTVLQRRSSFERARTLAAGAIPMVERLHPEGHPLLAIGLMALGRAQLGAGASADALASFDRAIATSTKIYGATHLQTAAARVARGQALGALGRIAEARTVIQAALNDLAAKHGDSQTAKDGAAALAAVNRRKM